MIEITKMTLLDFEEILPILLTDFDNFWSPNILKSELQNKNSIYFVAKENNEIAGFAGFTIFIDEADITNIVVKKNYRQKKIGYELMQALFNTASSLNLISITLEVCENNLPAISLYNKCGFIICGRRKNYYDNGDAILMRKQLQ